VPKYRHRIVTGPAGNEVSSFIWAFSDQKHVEILEMSAKPDHAPVIAVINPKLSVSHLSGTVKRERQSGSSTSFKISRKYSIGVILFFDRRLLC
jgi:putative transposase